jgi:hypothetical protein
MKSDTLNELGCGAAPGFEYGRTRRVEPGAAVHEMRGAGGGTISLLTGAYGVPGAVNAEVSTSIGTASTANQRREKRHVPAVSWE